MYKSLYAVLSSVRIRLYRHLFPAVHSLAYWLNKIAAADAQVLIHIGSHDGRTGDPFYDLICRHKKWQVLFVEPVPYLFKRLQANFPPEARFRFENAAVNEGTLQIFYYVQEQARQHVPSLPAGFDQLGSFDRNNLVKHLDGKLEPYIVAREIQGITLEALLHKHQIATIDILHIDTEGHDWKILSQLNLNQYQPLLILFEHINLSPIEKGQSIQFLKDRYYIFESEADFLCINRHTPFLFRKPERWCVFVSQPEINEQNVRTIQEQYQP
jgi:FkbM family methyltransferase